ncbi:MAG: hypothetical protein ACM3SY_07910 [Candidatus Omnitrophota bacterium]
MGNIRLFFLSFENIKEKDNFLGAGLKDTSQYLEKGTKINMVLIPGFNDDEVERMQEFCHQNGLTLQRIHHYVLENISSIDRHYAAERPLACRFCNRIRLTADGKLKPCLFSGLEIPLDFTNLRESIIRAIQSKPEAGASNPDGKNWQIGG